MKVWVVETPEAWERLKSKLAELSREEKSEVILIKDEGVVRCPRCDPEPFRYLRQFVLDGGRLVICARSLARYGIPETRPPEFFERVPDGEVFLQELRSQGYQVESV